MENIKVTQGDIPLRDMESNVVARFSKAFEARFNTVGSEEREGWANTTLGKQDAEFADHLLAANARFAIIEFKATLEAIETETRKGLRQKLFAELAIRSDFLRRSLDIHMVCWGTIETHQPPGFEIPVHEEVDMLSRYAAMVAPFMNVKLNLSAGRSMPTEKFLDRFLGARTVGGTYGRFRKYLNELGAIAGRGGGDSATIQGMVCVYLPGSATVPGRYAHARFRGLEELQLLMQPRGLERESRLPRSRSRDRDYPSRNNGPRLGL